MAPFDGLNMAPRPGEPESAMLPGMAAPRPQNSPPEGAGPDWFTLLHSMPDTSGPFPQPPGATIQEVPTWAYDFDPANGSARATFNGEVSFTSGGPSTPSVASFNTRTGAVVLNQADVSAVAVGSFNGRTGAVTLSTADVNAVAPAPGTDAGCATTFLLTTNVALATTPATPTAIINTGAIGLAGQKWRISAKLYFGAGATAPATATAVISNGTVAISGGEVTAQVTNQTATLALEAIVTLAGPTTFTLFGVTNGSGVALRSPILNAIVPSAADKMTSITATRLS